MDEQAGQILESSHAIRWNWGLKDGKLCNKRKWSIFKKLKQRIHMPFSQVYQEN